MVIDVEEKSSGSGFVVRSEKSGNKYRNLLVTAQHAVDGGGTFLARCFTYQDHDRPKSHKDHRMYVYAVEDKFDLAVAFFESDERQPTVELDLLHKKHIGGRVHHVGFGLADDARVDHGIITQPRTSSPEAFAGTIRTNAYAISGDSGGPLFNDRNRVIGVCQAVRTHKDQLLTHQSYFTDIASFKTWHERSDITVEFVYNHEAKTPVLPFVKMGLQGYKYKFPQE